VIAESLVLRGHLLTIHNSGNGRPARGWVSKRNPDRENRAPQYLRASQLRFAPRSGGTQAPSRHSRRAVDPAEPASGKGVGGPN
jgi:hypothetical protein